MNSFDSSWLVTLVSQVAFALPRLLVSLAGLGLALAARRRQPRSAALAMGGFGLALLLDLGLHPLQMWLVMRSVQGDLGDMGGLRSLGTVVMPVFASLLSALAWGLVLAALHQAWAQGGNPDPATEAGTQA